MKLSLKELSPYSVSLENDRFDGIVENIDSIDISDNEIELEATLIHEIELESRDEPVEVAIFIEMRVSAEDLEYDRHEEYVYASRLRASSNYEIDEEDQYSDQELREIKTYIEKYLVGSDSDSTYKLEGYFED